jgi:hypothetical protein
MLISTNIKDVETLFCGKKIMHFILNKAITAIQKSLWEIIKKKDCSRNIILEVSNFLLSIQI